MGSGAGSESGWGRTAGTLSQHEAFPSCPPSPLNQASQGLYEMSTGDSGHPLNWGGLSWLPPASYLHSPSCLGGPQGSSQPLPCLES